MAITPFPNAVLSFNGNRASPDVANAIQKASARTGVDFKYLVAQAGQESSFKPDAKASTSSATGLYQFIESTWLQMVRDKGAAHGLGDMAQQIDADFGSPRVADPAMRRKILDLRNDPSIAAVMAAEFAKGNRAQLEGSLGRGINSTELYMAHFLGANGATKFLNALDASPDRKGSDLLPEAAAANRGAFYDRDGKALSVKDIYNRYAAKFDGELKSTPVAATADTAQPARPQSVASMVRATLMSALGGGELSPVTIQALMALDVPGALNKQNQDRDGRKPSAG
jgi:hypothetical protein